MSSTQLDATASVAGTFVYTPAAARCCHAGNGQTLSVTFTPTDTTDYTTATDSVSINVGTGHADDHLAHPGGITYGTALGGTQLDATASVAGTFAYTPGSGTVLAAGNDQTLSVTFTPTDTTDYTTATGQRIDQRCAGHADDHLVQPGGHHLRHGLGRHATGRHGQRGRDVRLHARQRHGARRRQRQNAFGDVHAHRHDRLHHGDHECIDQRRAGHADDHLVQPGGHHLRHGLGRHATGRHGQHVPGTFVYTPASGTLLPAGNADLSVTFTPTDTTDYTTATNSVSINVAPATPTITWPNPADITYGTALGGTQLDATASTAGTFAYTPGSGTVLHAGNGQTLSVTFTPTDIADYTAATKSVRSTSHRPRRRSPGPTRRTSPMARPWAARNWTPRPARAGTFVYTPGSGTVLPVGNGQTLSVTFTPTDTTDYTTATKNVAINVGQATPTISWSNPAAITYGTPLGGTQLDATASTAGTFAYTPTNGTLLPSRHAKPLGDVHADGRRLDYTTATNSVSINVTDATPTIIWSNPAAITYGTPLGAMQLDATASTAGTFVYSPASGTVLLAGNGQTLSVTFTPADTVDYTAATEGVSINVAQAAPTITWATPTAIAYGTTLGATQLDASASVAGTYAYAPAAGQRFPSATGRTFR